MDERLVAFFQIQKRLEGSIAFLVSLATHVLLLLILALWVFTAGKNSQGVTLLAQLSRDVDTAQFDTIVEFDLSPEDVPNPLDELPVEPQDELLAIDVDIKLETDEPGTQQDLIPNAALTTVSAEDVLAGLRPQGDGRRGAHFFGTYAEGNRFVYVLDSSNSMEGDRWVYACNELIDSLNALESDQEFAVICFDLVPTILFNKPPDQIHFYRPTAETIVRVRRWLRGRTLGPATMPASALQIALSLGPDAIFMLSDGELQDNTIGMLRQLNQGYGGTRQIPIHTIHLFSMEGRLALQQIAMENGGTFTSVRPQPVFGRRLRR